jgi:glycosyltransferase involved in cell wall biosynthesis
MVRETIRLRSASREFGRLRIVVLAPSEEPVPPRTYGGSELVAYNVTEELVRRGHEVYLIAAGTSKTTATLVPIAEKSFREIYANSSLKSCPADYQALREYWNVKCCVEATAIIRSLKPDVVHNHVDWVGVLLQSLMPCPMITTVHLLTQKQAMIENPQGNYVSISNNQRKDLPTANWVATVYNGVDVSRFEQGNGDGGYFAFLGRISPEKGIAEICRMIRSTNHRLKIAAKIDAMNMDYYLNEVKPLIDGEQIEYIGEVDFAGKNAFLKDAKALLLWLNWEEPFGLVVVEANACGTPVVVNRRGSMREVMQSGVNGYLVETVDEMKDKLDIIDLIDRSRCREHVESRFDVSQMVDGYEKIARTVICGSLKQTSAF